MSNTGMPRDSLFALPEISNRDFTRIAAFIKQEYGIDLTRKKHLIAGRLATTVKTLGYPGFTELIDHVIDTKDRREIDFILSRLTTNYTYFMREQDHLELFSDQILPRLIKRHSSDRVLSVWSAGCATGEEPYNISMYILDRLGDQARYWDTRILATDISEQALATARAGRYFLPDTIREDWRQSFFTENADGSSTVSSRLRKNVIFRNFNLMDPIRFRRPFDVIFCRNVMIYFDQTTKDGLIDRFYQATVPGGYLLTGYSENLSQSSPYRRIATATYQKNDR